MGDRTEPSSKAPLGRRSERFERDHRRILLSEGQVRGNVGATEELLSAGTSDDARPLLRLLPLCSTGVNDSAQSRGWEGAARRANESSGAVLARAPVHNELRRLR